MGLSKTTKRDKKSQLIQGIQLHFAKTKTVTLQGKPLNVPNLVSLLQASIDAGKDTDGKRAIYLEAAKASREADAAVEPTALVFTNFLESTMSPTDLADFGITVKARAVPDVATKAAAVVKSAATRKARGTMSKKQKSKIVGVVSDTTPPPAPTAEVAPAAPSATAKTNGSAMTN
jgi:hypothetical protein